LEKREKKITSLLRQNGVGEKFACFFNMEQVIGVN
jgi:hypothetical protein